MAEVVGNLLTIKDTVNFLLFQKNRLNTAVTMWNDIWNIEEDLLADKVTSLNTIYEVLTDRVSQIGEIIGTNDVSLVKGVGFELNKLRGQYACPLEAGKLFINWNIGATTLTIEGAGGRISAIGTDTNNRFKVNAKISISNAEDPENNGIHTLTTVSGLVLTASGSSFTANTNDTQMIVTLIETVAA